MTAITAHCTLRSDRIAALSASSSSFCGKILPKHSHFSATSVPPAFPVLRTSISSADSFAYSVNGKGTCSASFHPICAGKARYRLEVWGKHGFDNVATDYRSSTGLGTVVLDDYNFRESVVLISPGGEFPVMSYHMTQEFKPPFHISTLIEEAGPLKAEVIINVSAEFSLSITTNRIVAEMPLPKYTTE